MGARRSAFTPASSHTQPNGRSQATHGRQAVSPWLRPVVPIERYQESFVAGNADVAAKADGGDRPESPRRATRLPAFSLPRKCSVGRDLGPVSNAAPLCDHSLKLTA